MIERDLGVAWRTCFTGLSFLFFGLGSLVLGLLVMPVVHLLSRDRQTAQSVCRAAVRSAFRLFIWFMRSTGVLDYRITGNIIKVDGGESLS